MWVLLVLSLLCCLARAAHFKTQLLREGWKMELTGCPQQLSNLVGQSFDVTVPSTIHLNLEKHSQIPNPFLASNLKALEAVSDCSAKFSKTFQLDQTLNSYSKVALEFAGIDTYSTIFLNGVQLGQTNNAFLKYEYEVRERLKVGQNVVAVHLRSSKALDAERQKVDRMPFQYAHTRKACYQYSWDWAPYMNTLGIWLPVSLTFYDQAKFDFIWIRNKEITQSYATLDFTFVLQGVPDQNLSPRALQVQLLNKNSGQQVTLQVESKYSSFKLIVRQPRLWWPNNIGEPYLYQFQATLTKNGHRLDRKRVVYGIRTVELNSEGANFQVKVNGYAIYCKGANYVPPDMMYPRLTNPDFSPAGSDTIQTLLSDAAHSNFNMLRVWGGGQYQSDHFYELASRKGIMLFHDFMFSDSVYPATPQFLENVRREVVYQVRRLRNYPAIVLWSGNNQILQGIQSWGWGQPRYRQNYDKLFNKLIPEILAAESADIPYIESSPSKGVGNSGFARGGDIHYWGVWAAASPFQTYQTSLGGFNSEFGTQSLPVWQTILQFTDSNGRMYDSEQLAFHQKHRSRFNTLRGYIGRYSKQSINFEMEAYNSGLVQAYGLEIALRAQRCAKPKSFGTLYWQLNDAWPAISWSSIDYYGRWKPLQFLAKNYFKDVILFYHPHAGKFIAINDKLVPMKCYYVIKVLTFKGEVLFEESKEIDLEVNEKRELSLLEASVFSGKESRSFVYTEIVYGLHEDNKTIVTTFFRPMKDLQLEPAVLQVKYEYSSDQIVFESSYLIKSLYVSNSKQYLKFSDNYFDVVPGVPKRVKVVSPPSSLQELKATMNFRSYREIYEPAGLSVNVRN